MIRKIKIDFPVSVGFPPGWEQALDALIGQVCLQYEKDNPTQVMWVAGGGSEPIWNEPHEPTFDSSVFHLEIATREDLYGNNPWNPNRDALRKEVNEKRQLRQRSIKANNARYRAALETIAREGTSCCFIAIAKEALEKQ